MLPLARVRQARFAAVAALAAVGLVLAAGCSSDSDSNAAPTATLAKPTTTTTSTTIPLDDFDAVMRHILTRRDEAYEQNKPEYLDEIYLPECKCLEGEKAEIGKRIAEGVHTEGERLRVLKVELVNRIGDSVAVVRVIYEQGPHRLVDRDGNTVRDQGTEPPTSLIFSLALDDGRWKVEFIEPEGPVDPATLN